MGGIGGADQGEIFLIGNGKYDPAIRTLKEVAFVMVKQPPGDDMTATNQPHCFARVLPHGVLDQVFDPGATGIDQHTGPHGPIPVLRPQ